MSTQMELVETSLPGVVLVQSPVHVDERGFFAEAFRADRFAALGLPTHFVQDNHSRSARGVLRGLHYQLEQPQGKLIRVVRGRIFDVAVDLRRSSPSFGHWFGVTLEAGDGRQLFVPPGFAHGYLALEDADIMYKCTTLYHRASDAGVRFDDTAIGIDWPIRDGEPPILSPRDQHAPALADAQVFD